MERPSSTTGGVGDASGGAGQEGPVEEDPEGDPAGDLGEDLGEDTVEDLVENTIEISDGERDSMDVDSTTTTDSKPQVGVYIIMPPLKGGHIALHLSVGMSVCRSVCRSVGRYVGSP